MGVVLRADDVPVASRAEWWRHVLGEMLGPLDPVELPDQVRVGELGAVRVAELWQRMPGGAKRTAAHVRSSDAELCKVDVVARGSGVIEQGGRRARLGPGDLTLVDLSRPVQWTMSSEVRIAAVVFPPAMLSLRRDELARLTAVRIAGDRGAGALASSFARQLTGHLDDGGADRARLGTAALDLITVALAGRLDHEGEVPQQTRQRALVLRIRGFVEEHLGDPGLTPGSIAAAHHVSVRYLHKLFAAERTTVGAWIRHRRLERCRRDLLDPALRASPVSAIAADHGLVNPAHFSRLFRDAYGVTPAEYRALASGSAAGPADAHG